jgi:pyruvate-ferredoxin/flavodoxin oxidoreductase
MALGLDHQRMAVDSGYWPLYRYDPRRSGPGEAKLVIDSRPPKTDVALLMENESRFQITASLDPERYHDLVDRMHRQIGKRMALYQELARVPE